MDRSFASRRDARYAAWLFCVAGALAIANAWTPGVCPPELRPAFTRLGLLDIAVGAALVRLPWERWPRRALLVIAAAALVIVDLFAIIGHLEPWIYSVFFMVTAVWLGLSLPRWSTAWLAPALAAAYVIPLLRARRADEAISTVGLVVPIVVLVGETIAYVVTGLRDASMRDELTGVGNRRHGMAALERLGGEEFLVVASQPRTAAGTLARRLVEDWRGLDPRTTISVGATVRAAGESPIEVLARADRALYAAKRGGRDRSSFVPSS